MKSYTATGLNGRWTAGILRFDYEKGMSIRSLSAKYCKSRSSIKHILSQPDDYIFHSSSFLASCVALATMAQSYKPHEIPDVLIGNAQRLVKRMKDRVDDDNYKKILELLKKTELAEILDLN